MQQTILITGSTDGIGLETARRMVMQGHRVLLHGRNPRKLGQVEQSLASLPGEGCVEAYVADLSRLQEVELLAQQVTENHDRLDVLINNAGVFRTADSVTAEGFDVRFVVNTFAPYLLTRRLLPLLGESGRVVNLSSAAQATVDLNALCGEHVLSDEFAAYAQSKLALTMWSREMALELGERGPVIVAVNPGSLLATRMVKEGFGLAGNDIGIGADILLRAALSDEFADSSGQYFDNDAGRFASPHPDVLDPEKRAEVVREIEEMLAAKDSQSSPPS